MNNHRHERLLLTADDEFIAHLRTPDEGRIITFIRNAEKRVVGLSVDLWSIKGMAFENVAAKVP